MPSENSKHVGTKTDLSVRNMRFFCEYLIILLCVLRCFLLVFPKKNNVFMPDIWDLINEKKE